MCVSFTCRLILHRFYFSRVHQPLKHFLVLLLCHYALWCDALLLWARTNKNLCNSTKLPFAIFHPLHIKTQLIYPVKYGVMFCYVLYYVVFFSFLLLQFLRLNCNSSTKIAHFNVMLFRHGHLQIAILMNVPWFDVNGTHFFNESGAYIFQKRSFTALILLKQDTIFIRFVDLIKWKYCRKCIFGSIYD